MFKFYLTARSVNEATDFYIGLIERAIKNIGQESSRVYRIGDIRRGDVVITIEAKDFVKVKILRPFTRQLCWFQGIVPEEALMMFNSRWRKAMWEIFERFTLSASSLNLFVSEAMHAHYQGKYKYQGHNYLVIPCYNKHINKEAFYKPGKYDRPTFVYSGSMATWQCIDQMLQIFSRLESRLEGATLTILTGEQDKARQLVDKHRIRNVKVSHCSLAQLDAELGKYKYGFIIREDHIVNNVATPTKMNTYMAMGVIPVYCDVVSAFRENLHFGDTAVCIPAEAGPDEAAAQILAFENQRQITDEALYSRYKTLFDVFYNDGHYVAKLAEKIKENIKC